MSCAFRSYCLRLHFAAHDIDELDSLCGAQTTKYAPQVRTSRAIEQCGISLGSHRLDHRQSGQRIDERAGALRRLRGSRQRQAIRSANLAVARIHAACPYSYRLAQKSSRCWRVAGVDDTATSFGAEPVCKLGATSHCPAWRIGDSKAGD